MGISSLYIGAMQGYLKSKPGIFSGKGFTFAKLPSLFHLIEIT